MKEQEGMDRREALKVAAMAAVGIAVGAGAAGATSVTPPKPPGDPALKLDPTHKVDPSLKITLPKAKFMTTEVQTKMLSQARVAKLTPAAAKLTKEQLLQLDPKAPEKFGLNKADIASIQEAWKGIAPPKGIGPGGRPGTLPGKIGGGGSPVAAGDVSCCCCTPCCCAAAVMEPVRLV